MSKHTRLGQYLNDWLSQVTLSYGAKWLWLTMYTSPLAKKCLPGIMYTSVDELASACRDGYVNVEGYLRELIDVGLVEHDSGMRVLRMTELPDKCERPVNGNVLRMFWNRWRELPESPLKYRHVALIKWLAQPFPTKKYEDVWDETFGTIEALDTVAYTVSSRVAAPVEAKRGGIFQSQQKRRQSSMFSTPDDTVKDTVGYTVPSTVGLKVEGSNRTVSDVFPEPEGSPPAPAKATTHRVNRGRQAPRVPSAKLPFTVGEMLDAMFEGSGGRVTVEPLDPRTGEELWRVVTICDAASVSLADVRLAGEFLAAGHLSYRSDLDARWVAGNGTLLGVVSKARLWEAGGRLPVAGSGRRTPSQERGPSARDIAGRAARLKAEGL